MNTELLIRVQQINPATSKDSIPVEVWDAQQMLEQLQHRAGDSISRRRGPDRPWLVAAAVAVVILVLIGGLGVLTADTDAPPVITQPEPTPTTLPESSPTTVPETTSTTTLPERAPPSTSPVSWARVSWEPGTTGPAWGDFDSAPWGLVGVNRAGGIWVSVDGFSWETRLTTLTVHSLLDGGTYVVLAGTLNEEGTSTVLISRDGSTWDELDTSVLATPGTPLVQAAFPSGLLSLHNGGMNLIGTIEDNRLTRVHTSSLRPNGPKLIELNGQLLAFEDGDRSSPRAGGGLVWRYLGDGEWSEPTSIPVDSQYAQLNGRIYAFDHQNATCCGTEQPGPLPWRLLASDDGVTWQEAEVFEMHAVYSLAVAAGDTFLIHGQQDAGGPGIRPFDHVFWISVDAETWHEVDTSFGFEPTNSDVEVVGDFIYLVDRTGDNQGISPLVGGVWIGSPTQP